MDFSMYLLTQIYCLTGAIISETHITNIYFNTVGEQSIAHAQAAQSIAHGHIGDSICKKTKFSKNYSYKDKKGSI